MLSMQVAGVHLKMVSLVHLPPLLHPSTPLLQAEGSTFKMVEVSVGGSLARHDLGITQVGPETTTTMRHFLLAGGNQLQDLHSRLVLDHPRGEANQLHKCIVSAPTGRGVFDGNVKVGVGNGMKRGVCSGVMHELLEATVCEIDQCTALGPCSTRHMTPTRLLVVLGRDRSTCRTLVERTSRGKLNV